MTTHPGGTLAGTSPGRVAYATLAAVLLVAIVAETITYRTGYWQIAAFGFAPNLTAFLGAGAGLAKGQFHPRGVGAYNLMHRFWGPLALLALAAAGLLGVGFLVGGLTWAFHVALDRTLGLRTADPRRLPGPQTDKVSIDACCC